MFLCIGPLSNRALLLLFTARGEIILLSIVAEGAEPAIPCVDHLRIELAKIRVEYPAALVKHSPEYPPFSSFTRIISCL
jgi:hypothetical protein